ncbi:MAG: hypothetical protein AABY18_08285 [Candidatus Thermoplasmatota archaeon]
MVVPLPASEQVPPSPKQALQNALQALSHGLHDSRLASGAQLNALESIAWSLIGILEKQVEAQAAAPDDGGGKATMSDELLRHGFLQIDPS